MQSFDLLCTEQKNEKSVKDEFLSSHAFTDRIQMKGRTQIKGINHFLLDCSRRTFLFLVFVFCCLFLGVSIMHHWCALTDVEKNTHTCHLHTWWNGEDEMHSHYFLLDTPSDFWIMSYLLKVSYSFNCIETACSSLYDVWSSQNETFHDGFHCNDTICYVSSHVIWLRKSWSEALYLMILFTIIWWSSSEDDV